MEDAQVSLAETQAEQSQTKAEATKLMLLAQAGNEDAYEGLKVRAQMGDLFAQIALRNCSGYPIVTATMIDPFNQVQKGTYVLDAKNPSRNPPLTVDATYSPPNAPFVKQVIGHPHAVVMPAFDDPKAHALNEVSATLKSTQEETAADAHLRALKEKALAEGATTNSNGIATSPAQDAMIEMGNSIEATLHAAIDNAIAEGRTVPN